MTASNSSNIQPEREILPDNVLPVHYFLSYPKIEFGNDFKFQGNVEIELDIKSPANSITLNTIEIAFVSVSIQQKEIQQSIAIQSLQFNEETEQVIIPLTTELVVGAAKLNIEFIGTLNDKMKGFYRSKYKNSNGDQVFCGITQFEPVDARRAFPCFDEPAKKASFTVQLTVPKELVCLSNMPVAKETMMDDNISKCLLFDRTPIMSVYLLAWCIGEFECIESKTDRGILVRLWTTVGNTKKVQFACKTACRCLDFYEEYFGIKYPLPKCDMIAVPDFAAGAMENWGLVTYREARLMCDEETAALRVKQRICLVIAHELAHQWFGNLVTMDWWSQIWLNEGFARYMEYFCSNALFPDWDIWNLFMSAAFNRAFSLDGMVNSHKIELDIYTCKDIPQVFDGISYAKGASVVRMVAACLTDDVFKNALNKYLTHFQYKNATTNDLWTFLSQESGKSVSDIMGAWTSKQGFPLIEVSRNGNILTFAQSRYLSSGKPTEEQNAAIWNVPIFMKMDGKAEPIQYMLTEREGSFDMATVFTDENDCKNCKWIHINANSTGFYCCKYGAQMIASLNEVLLNKQELLSVIDKVCLVRDAKALAVSCNFDGATVQLLNLVHSLAAKEKSYLVWNEILSAVGSVYHILDDDTVDTENTENVYKNQFKSIVIGVLEPMYRQLQWGGNKNENNNGNTNAAAATNTEDDAKTESVANTNTNASTTETESESETTKDLFRPLILSAMNKYGDVNTIKETVNRFHAYMKAETDSERASILVSSLRQMVFCVAIANGTEVEFNLLKAYYLQTGDALEKRRSLIALGRARDPTIIGRTLEWTLTSDEVRSQDKMYVFSGIAHSSKQGKELAWTFLRERWDHWYKVFDGGFQLGSLAKIPSGFVTNAKADEVEQFFYQTLDQSNIAKCNRSVSQCIEQIRKNAKWRATELENVQLWCKAKSNSDV